MAATVPKLCRMRSQFAATQLVAQAVIKTDRQSSKNSIWITKFVSIKSKYEILCISYIWTANFLIWPISSKFITSSSPMKRLQRLESQLLFNSELKAPDLAIIFQLWLKFYFHTNLVSAPINLQNLHNLHNLCKLPNLLLAAMLEGCLLDNVDGVYQTITSTIRTRAIISVLSADDRLDWEASLNDLQRAIFTEWRPSRALDSNALLLVAFTTIFHHSS